MLYQYSDALKNASNIETIPQYLDVPEYLDSDLRNLAEAITQNTTTDYEAITALESYLENYYEYNLSCPEPPPGTDPLEYFLYQSGEGVCSHFNTALVMLARSLGFSARLVGGYYIDPTVEEQLVYPIQSHAFTEIPFEDLGWIIFDATPPAQIADMIDQIPDLNLSDLDGSGLDECIESCDPSGEVNPPHERVFKIYGKTGSPYLRDGVGEYYNGSWYQLPALSIPYNGHIIDSLITGYQNETEYRYIIEPYTPFTDYLPGPQNPVQLERETNTTYYPEQKLFRLDQSSSTGYQITGAEYQYTPSALDNAELYMVDQFIQIDPVLDSRIETLALDISRYEPTPHGKVNALASYLRTNFLYNLTAAPEPEDVDPVVWLLFYEKQGKCTDFATALTMLARSIDIPARLVVGYLVNSEVEVQDVYADQAHAYTEVLFDGIGWIVFEPTPSGEPDIDFPTGLVPTFTNITYQDSVVNVGGEYQVVGTVVDESANPIEGLEVLVYLKQVKDEMGTVSGQGVVSNGVFNITCHFPPNLPAGEYMVDAHTIGDETYMDSWSDPPLTAFTETSFIIQAPAKVISRRPYSVNATLVDHNTNTTIPNTGCTVSVGNENYIVQTDNQGIIELSTSSDEGNIDIHFNWDGTGYTLGAEAHNSIESIPLEISLPQEPILVRGERSIIRGQVMAEELIGSREPISLEVLDDQINTVTNGYGEFFIAKTTPTSTELGSTPLIFEILNDGEVSTSSAIIKARTSLTLDVPVSGQADKKTDVSIKLTDDRAIGLGSFPVNITYTIRNSTYAKTVFTDQNGEAITEIQLPKNTDNIELFAEFTEQGNYLSAVTSKSIFIVTPTEFPLYQMLALILVVGGFAGIFYMRDQNRKNIVEIEDIELVHQVFSDRLSLSLPDIEDDLPAVWALDHPLTIEGRVFSENDTPATGQNVVLLLNETVLGELTSDSEGKIHHSEAIPVEGIHRIFLRFGELATKLDIKIVVYRDEIIRLFNNRFKESREMFEAIKDNYTARELYEYLRKETPEPAHEPLRELVFIFEEANYSLHDVDREHYTTFFRAMRKYKEALNGENS